MLVAFLTRPGVASKNQDLRYETFIVRGPQYANSELKQIQLKVDVVLWLDRRPSATDVISHNSQYVLVLALSSNWLCGGRVRGWKVGCRSTLHMLTAGNGTLPWLESINDIGKKTVAQPYLPPLPLLQHSPP